MNTKSFFGKKNINKIKQGFIDDSIELISKDVETYKEIEKIGFNLECNICSTKLNDQVFTKHNIKYYRCGECGMMGAGKISNYSEYNDLLYQDISYGSYTGFEESRLSEIYIPKADYLIKILPDIRERGVIDIGAGLGYFVKALLLAGVKAKGYEINKDFVNNFNVIEKNTINSGALIHVEHEQLIDHLKNEDTNQVISLIGVLEHVEDPVKLLTELKNIGFKNFFISVPLFGFSTHFEAMNENYYHRQLAPDHSYLYTEDALLWLQEKIGLSRLSEWYFGQDMHDISRFLLSQGTGFNIQATLEMFEKMQLVIDESKFSSEIHLIWEC